LEFWALGLLSRLPRLVPTGLVVTAAWLNGHGYSSALLRKYVANGWLEQPARGIYRRQAGKLLWQHVVVSLQTLLETPVFVGGRTALEQQSLSHYVSQNSPREVHLYFDAKPPGWIRKVRLEESLVLHRSRRLFKSTQLRSSGIWNNEHQAFLGRVSTPAS
jgi:transcriptional regulator with AbiEi antitoxin domain of type IV toxin-antitoxin system